MGIQKADMASTATALLLVVVALTPVVWCDASGTLEEAMPMHSETLPVPGKMSLVQIKAQSMAAAQGTEVMTEDMEIQTKKDIIELSSNFKSSGMQMESIQTTKLAKKVLAESGNLGESQSTQGSGLDLIFRKLDELEKKIKNEQDTDWANEQAGMEACRDALKQNDGVITKSSDTRANNQLSIRECSKQIVLSGANRASLRTRTRRLLSSFSCNVRKKVRLSGPVSMRGTRQLM